MFFRINPTKKEKNCNMRKSFTLIELLVSGK